MVSARVGRLVGLQVGVTGLCSLLLLLLYGEVKAISALIGGAVGFTSSLGYALIISGTDHLSPGRILRRHLLGEATKLWLTVLIFGTTFVLYADVAVVPLFATYVMTLLVYWAALLFD